MTDSFHTISNRDVWNSLEEIKRTLGKMDNTLNNLDSGQKAHQEKIRALEVKYYGVIAGLVTSIALIVTAFIL